MASLNYSSKLMEQSYTDVSVDQRGQFYDFYMRKREVKLREEWRARGAEKEAELRAMMETLASTSTTMMSKGKATESKNYHSRQINSRRLSSSSSDAFSTSRSSAKTILNPIIRSTNSSNPRKENTKLSTGISNETTLLRSIARTKSSSDRMSFVKDIKARRSQSLRKNSASLGEPNDFMPLYSDPDASTPPMHKILHRSGGPKPLLRKSNGTGPTVGLSTDKLRIYMASQAPINEEDQPKESTEMQKEGNEKIGSVRADVRSFLSEASDLDSSVDSPRATGGSHNMNQYLEGKTVRVRKKWGSVERPFLAVDASTHPITDVTKGIKRFLKFGKRSRGIKIHNDKEDGHDSENYSFEDLRNSRMAQIPSFDSFNEDKTLHEQVNPPHNPSHSASLKEREKRLLGNYPKAARSLFPLPSFHGRENETKSRRRNQDPAFAGR